MKKLSLLAAAFLGIGCALSSCENESSRMDGDWDPIIVDKSEIKLPLSGGKDSVRITKNYNSWWTCRLDKNGEIFHCESIDTVKCDGFVAVVPKDRKNYVIINVSASDKPNSYKLSMQCGDAFKDISIKQE